MRIREAIIATAATAITIASLPTTAAEATGQNCAAASSSAPLSYPLSRQVDQVDDYHGTKVADPYRWLEDGNSAETADWITAQNRLTQSYLGTIAARV
jgi:prolyl oligopeptidase